MKKIFLPFILILIFILPGYCHTGDIERIDDREYFPAVKKLISEAKKSIYIVMYMATYNPNKPKSPSNQLLTELAKAHKRGVKVDVILDQDKPHSDKSHYNDPVYYFLQNSGVNVYYEEVHTKTHPKLIIIDGIITVIGSHNWSDSALKNNRETTVIIKSPEIARGYIDWFNKIPVRPRYEIPSEIKTQDIYLPCSFLTDPNIGIKLYRNKFDLYLYLLKEWEGNGCKPFLLDYDETAKFIEWSKYPEKTYRVMINAAIRSLQRKNKLVSAVFNPGKPAVITLLDYDNSGAELNPQAKDCFTVPGAFWEFGWVQRLSRNAKYFYFINLLEISKNPNQKGWWSRSRKYLYKKYYLNSKIMPKAIKELRVYHLLKVKYSPYEPSIGKHISPSSYLLLPLYSWEVFQQELENLCKIYGRGKVETARKLAGIILEENNPEVIEKLINYADQYGDSIVHYAIDYVAKKPLHNSRRSFVYVEAVIRNSDRERKSK